MRWLFLSVMFCLTLISCARHEVISPKDVVNYNDSDWNVISEPKGSVGQ